MAWENPYRQSKFMELLCLSNGHGEDVIAVRILAQLHQQLPTCKIAALPIVGTGQAYSRAGIQIAGPVQQMPSGGFIYLDGGKQAWRDLRGGLAQLTWQQWQAVRHWPGKILAVGDIVPLAFAWGSNRDYAFVGTAKSEYYLRQESGAWLPQTPWFDRRLGGVYLPWERWLLRRQRCKGIFPRDRLTTEILQQQGIPAADLGNPMMDAIAPEFPTNPELDTLKILLLPGSRPSEAVRNWQPILTAVASILDTFSARSITFLGAIAPGISLKTLATALPATWQPVTSAPKPIADPDAWVFQVAQRKCPARLQLTQKAYHSCLRLADVAIAMAGTATEQFVGLGKPAFTFAGTGPQFVEAFAEAQSRHLGAAIIFVESPQAVAIALQELLADSERLAHIASVGRQRLGPPGAAERIATRVSQQLLGMAFE
ncbi:MAG: lipid-A-disaccharide synthase-related protein [Cyanobacteria bacterium J06641_5]